MLRYLLLIISISLCTLGAQWITYAAYQIIQPYTIVGGSILFTIGFVITIIISDEIRVLLIKCLLPNKIRIMLYQKSLVDYVMEPSPSMKCFWSLIMSSFLNENEKLKMVMSLPDELNHLKKPGLIHLLPNDWRIFLGGSSFNNDSHSHIYNINDYNHNHNHHQTNTNDDIVNIDNDSTNNNNHHRQHSNSNNNNGIAFFNLPSTLLTSDYNDNDDSSTTATIESSDIGYLDTNTRTITASAQVNDNNNSNNNNSSNNFDEIVHEILSTRSTIILERVNSTINSSITNLLMRVLSGCDLHDSTLVGSFIVSISSLYYISSMMIEKRKLISSTSSSSLSSLSSSLNHIQYLLGSLLTPILSIASLTTGSALCIRNRHYLKPLTRSYTSSCLYINRLQSIIGKYINTTQTIILAALIMVSSLAIKYKLRYRHLKWIYQIALIRLLEIVKNIQGSIESMIEQR